MFMIKRYAKIIIISLCAVIPLGLIYSFFLFSHSMFIDMQKIVQKENVVAILVIGSGCSGYSAAIYGARGKINTVVLTGDQPSGQLNGTTKVENMPGLPDQLGPDIMQKLQKQSENFGAEIVYDSAVHVDCSQWPYVVTLQSGKKIYALTIIIATGASPIKLNIPGEQELWGKGVTTCAICDAPFHKDKDVIVVGGGDSAIEEALQLSAYAKTVTIVVRKDAMRAAPSMQDRLKSIDSIKVLYTTQVKEIYGNDEDGVTSVQLYNDTTKVTSNFPVSGVFLAIGHYPNSNLFKGCIKTDRNGYVQTMGKSQLTSMPGIFAAGDVEDHVYRQAGVAAGSGIKAALDALAFLANHGFNAPLAKKMEPYYFTNKKQNNNDNNGVKNNESSVKIVSKAHEFDVILSKQRIVVVDFYTEFCPSCKYMMPFFESVASQFANKALFIKIDANQIPELASRYKIATVPTLLLFKDGQLIERSNEALTEAELVKFIKEAF
jgi:thioredoxin reductase (NADPH)